jgi:GT2 family glycosyltransferase
MKRTIRIAVIIVTYNSERVLKNCLLELQRAGDFLSASRPCELQVVVVDNNSVIRPTCDAIPGTHILPLRSNVGFAAAVNKGLAALSEVDYVLLLNPDAYLKSDALASMLRVAEERQAAIVGPKLVGPDGLPNGYSERAFHSVRAEAARQLLGYRQRRYAGKLARRTGLARCLTGACLLVDAAFLQRNGGLDEAWPMYLEDVELCAAAHSAGLPVVLEISARCVHELGGSSNGVNFSTAVGLYLLLLSARVEFIRRRSNLQAAWMRVLIAIGAVPRLALSIVRQDVTDARRHAIVARWAVISGRRPPWPPS